MQKIHQILIIDDQPQNLQVLGNVLRNHKYKTGFATNGPSALEILDKIHFDLILLDVNMPEMNGFEVCKRIREKSKNKETPIIFLTANQDEGSIIMGFKVGGQDYVTKPFNNEELLSRVHTQLDLQDKTTQLKELNKNLEQKVKKRTLKISQISEELKVANKNLEVLDKLKSKFIRLISHELRTPLTGVVGFTEILKKDLANSKYSEKVNLLSEAVSRLNKISFKALLISELEAKEYHFQKGIKNLTSLINVECQNLAEEMEQKNLEIETNIGSQILVNIDPKIFHYGFMEVLENAIYYSNKNQQIKINTEVSSDFTTIIIRNSGSSFPEETLSNPFDHFSEGQKHKNKKIGMGLVIAKLMTEAHNGKIKISNSEFGAHVELHFANIDS